MITRPESPVYLRAIDEGDLEPVHRWHNDTAAGSARGTRPLSSPTFHPQPSRPPRR